MASMFWVPPNRSSAMPGYAYDERWFCDTDNTTCPPGWPGWRWDQAPPLMPALDDAPR